MNCGIALPLMRFQCSLHLRIHSHCLVRFALSDICRPDHQATARRRRRHKAAASATASNVVPAVPTTGTQHNVDDVNKAAALRICAGDVVQSAAPVQTPATSA